MVCRMVVAQLYAGITTETLGVGGIEALPDWYRKVFPSPVGLPVWRDAAGIVRDAALCVPRQSITTRKCVMRFLICYTLLLPASMRRLSR
jgi:hypothetical protein